MIPSISITKSKASNQLAFNIGDCCLFHLNFEVDGLESKYPASFDYKFMVVVPKYQQYFRH